MPYSCQLQFGTSGRSGTPVGAGRTCRAIGFPISQTSRLTMVHTTMRAPPGSFSGGRSTMAEYSQRSRGIIGPVMSGTLFDWLQKQGSGGAGGSISRNEHLQSHHGVRVHHKSERSADTCQPRRMQFWTVHAVDGGLGTIDTKIHGFPHISGLMEVLSNA